MWDCVAVGHVAFNPMEGHYNTAFGYNAGANIQQTSPPSPRWSLNCPNCGAPHEPRMCSYCKTPASRD